ncbi:hypothetical protein ACF0H5_020779 [Mactra antiquata]
MLLIVILLGISVLSINAAFDPCTDSNVTLIDDPRRRLGNIVSGSNLNQLLCDLTLQAGWFRFKDANIPFKCVSQFNCGTHVPLWIKGQYPSVDAGIVSLTACGDMDRFDNDCCDHKINVAAKNCGSHLVYFLQPTLGCSMAYCTDAAETCSGSKFSQTGRPPCVDSYPIMTVPPKLSAPILQGDNFFFRCTVPYPTNRTDGTFKVEWKVDGQVLSTWTHYIKGSQRVSVLPGMALQGHINKQLSCAVTSFFTNNQTGGLMSPSLDSNLYWAGIKYASNRYQLSQKTPSATLTLISTIPIVCRLQGPPCNLTFNVATRYENIALSTCTVSFEPTDWNPNTNTAEITFSASMLPNIPVTPPNMSEIITTEVTSPGGEWTGVQVPSTLISTNSNRPGAQCRTIGDPHYKTFDSKKHFFTDFRVGRFTMVNQLHGGSFRVETQTWKPHNTRPSFNCGVAIREGNDVVTLSFCDHPVSYPKLEIKNPSMFENHIEIQKDSSGNNYVFKGRSGAVVKVSHLKRRANMLNIFIMVPGTFMEDTEGICGYFDGDENNDIRRSNGHTDPRSGDKSAFMESWRIPHGQSLFERAVPLSLSQQTHCSCKANMTTSQQCGQPIPSRPHIQILCKSCSQVTPPLPLSTRPPTTTTTTATTTTTPTTTPAPVVTTNVPTTPVVTKAPTNKPTTQAQSTTTKVPEPTLSRSKATQICFMTLNKYQSALDCINNKDQVEFTDIVDMCVKDVQLTGDEGMWVSALQTLMEGCAFRELIKNNATFSLPPSAQTCPGACSGNGNCVNGVCICDADFDGTDCSFNTSAVPTFDGFNGLVNNCDMRSGNCYNPVAIGSNFHSEATQCYAMDIQFDEKGQPLKMSSTPSSTPTDFQSSHHVSCQLPTDTLFGQDVALKGYMVTLSNNNGATMSYNEEMYIIYDSKCIMCDTDNKCTVKPDTCLIHNKCYSHGQDVFGIAFCDAKQNQFVPSRTAPGTTMVTSTIRLPPSTTQAPVTMNNYTAVTTGCACITDVNSYDCACCKNWGCPCPTNKHSCFNCEAIDMCNH